MLIRDVLPLEDNGMRGTPDPSQEAIPLQEFMLGNWDYFGYGELESSAESTLTQLSRKLPPSYYGQIRSKLLEIMILTGLSGRLMAKTVIDSCIVVSDALRVASGKPSSTERILSSKFSEVLAPGDIRGEVERNIRASLEEGPALEVMRARQLLADHQKDAPFLAVYFETEADAVVTHEKGTFEKSGVEKWSLEKYVDVVVAFESGSLALVIAGTVIEGVTEAFLTLLVTLLQALADVIDAILAIAQALLAKSVDALYKLPDWVLAVLLGVGICAVLAYAYHEGFRNWVDTGAAELRRKLGAFITGLAAFAQDVWKFVRELLILLWNTMLPVTGALVVVGGVLIRRIDRLLITYQRMAADKS
jgi:hypothetical protein